MPQINATAVSITFSPPINNGNSPIIRYVVISNGSIIANGASSPIIITGLTPETTYNFTVAAVNGVGIGTQSSVLSITPTNYPRNTSLPVISGTLYETSTLSCTTGSWSSINPPQSYAYQWQRAGANIASATSSTYVLTASDVGNAIRCLVTATRGAYSTTANSTNTAVISAQGNVTSVSYLVVAGGGGGDDGNPAGGGGGAGGYRTGTLSVSVGSTYNVTVGAGGKGKTDTASANGTNSAFHTISSTGGGAGGQRGGSAGGNEYNTTVILGNLGGYTPREGWDGGGGSSVAGGGGGGASANGTFPNFANYGGQGGAGADSSLSGTFTAYAGGGGGGVAYTSTGSIGTGGYGGGGNGAFAQPPWAAATPGQFGTGGGGGGGATPSSYSTTYYYGASGGSGVVIVSYSEAYKAANTTTGSPTYTRTGGNHIYKWNGAGSIKF